MLIGWFVFTAAIQFPKYEPQSTESKATYAWFLDKLGFKHDKSVTRDHAYQTRAAFIADLKRCVDFSDYRYLRKEDNEQAFEMMVTGFLSIEVRIQVLGLLEPRSPRREGPFQGVFVPMGHGTRGLQVLIRTCYDLI